MTYYQFVEALSTIALPIIESEEEEKTSVIAKTEDMDDEEDSDEEKKEEMDEEKEKDFCYIALNMLKSFEKKKTDITREINDIWLHFKAI